MVDTSRMWSMGRIWNLWGNHKIIQRYTVDPWTTGDWSALQFISFTQSCPTLWNPWTAAHQASLSITNSRSLLKLMFIELSQWWSESEAGGWLAGKPRKIKTKTKTRTQQTMPAQVVPLPLATVWSCGPVALIPQKLCSLAWAGWGWAWDQGRHALFTRNEKK